MSCTFVETKDFSKYIYSYMDDEEYADFQAYLLANPFIGDVIPKSSGLRKIRWLGKGKGKRGGVRIIYFNRRIHDQIWLLTIYAKNECENLSDRELKNMQEWVPK